MTHKTLISIYCPDRSGLIAAVTRTLFQLGGDLSDTTFAVLESGAEFSSVCEFPADIAPDFIEREIKALPELADAEQISVRPFILRPDAPPGDVTHEIAISGGDQPGLVARLCEALVEFEANVVRLNTQASEKDGVPEYVIELAVWLPPDRSSNCLAALANTAESLGLTCRWVTSAEHTTPKAAG